MPMSDFSSGPVGKVKVPQIPAGPFQSRPLHFGILALCGQQIAIAHFQPDEFFHDGSKMARNRVALRELPGRFPGQDFLLFGQERLEACLGGLMGFKLFPG